MKIYKSVNELIGHTPLIELCNIEKLYDLGAKIYAKVELFNPSGSCKARIAKSMIENALKKDIINKDTLIIEPTSGNTGIGLAFICATLNMKFVSIMPENMSIERQKLIKAYGGEVILTPKEKGMQGSIDKANELLKEIPNSFIPSQFTNPDNPKTHILTTGPEIYDDLDGNVDMIVAGIGTGGTITGISKYLKSKKNIESIGVEPASSPLITKGYSGPHSIQGIGANFIPKTLDLKYIDKTVTITNEDAIKYAQLLAKKEGLFVGISSGAALKAAIDEAKNNNNKGKNIVVVLPDTGERYLSTDLVK